MQKTDAFEYTRIPNTDIPAKEEVKQRMVASAWRVRFGDDTLGVVWKVELRPATWFAEGMRNHQGIRCGFVTREKAARALLNTRIRQVAMQQKVDGAQA